MADVPHRDATLSVDERVADLLPRMTVEEKAGQLTQYFYLPDPSTGVSTEHDTAVETALRRGTAGSVLFVRDPRTANRLQRIALEGSRHRIPLLLGFDVIHGLRTVFPVPIALAATWRPSVIEEAQSVAAREARAVGVHWTFAPMVDIARDPRWGRIVEGAGEDPVLGAVVAAAQVRGFQGDLGEGRVLAGPKHLAGYGAARGGRDYDDADVSDAELWNVYLPPFRAAVDAGAANVMAAYMDLNGVPAAGNRWLLQDVLRDDLGFDGFVVSDANAVRSLETQHFAKDLTDAAVRAITAGVDVEMAMADAAFSRLPDAVASGRVPEATLDRAVGRVLRAKFRLGLFEDPFVDEAAASVTLTAPEHREVARAAAESSFVLLKNADGVLPLPTAALRSIAVIGELADSRRDTLGPWVFAHDISETVTVLHGLRARLAGSVEVRYAAGASTPGRVFPSIFDAMEPPVVTTRRADEEEGAIRRAVELAAGCDVAVVVVGQRQDHIGENASSAVLDLPGRQLEQLERVVATGTPVVLVVMSGRPLDLRWADAHVGAIVQAWYPGTRGGEALAAVLVGDMSPAGRLPFTWPRHVGHVPTVYAHYRTFAPAGQGSRYWEEASTPLYPFGHGLSYATFSYASVSLDPPAIPVGGSTTVSVDVTNTSEHDADEVVQLYVHQRYGTSSRPVRELKGFERVHVAAGGTRTVSFSLGPDQLRYWSAATGTVVQDVTTVDIGVGGDSEVAFTAVLEVTA